MRLEHRYEDWLLPGTCHFVGRRTNSEGWQHDAWEVTFRRNDDRRTLVIKYHVGIGQEQRRPNYVEVFDRVLAEAREYRDGQSFEKWAADQGYDDDSRRVERIWQALEAQTGRLAYFLGAQWDLFLDDTEPMEE